MYFQYPKSKGIQALFDAYYNSLNFKILSIEDEQATLIKLLEPEKKHHLLDLGCCTGNGINLLQGFSVFNFVIGIFGKLI